MSAVEEVGRVIRRETIVPEPAHALARLLDVDLPDLEAEGLPATWHWLYLLERPRQGDLGADGHPARGGLPAPPGPGRRRMWAGGRVRTFGPLRVGSTATRESELVSTKEKLGGSGRLTFVVVRHTVTQAGQTVVVEDQEVVYRDATEGGRTEVIPIDDPPPARDGDWSIDVDPTLLFRFSALTYNAHRIHYDRDYARDVEGYPGLLTHGPLQALVMAEAARSTGISGPVDFRYRLVAPLFDHQGLVVRADGTGTGDRATSVRDLSGRTTAQGSIVTLGEGGP